MTKRAGEIQPVRQADPEARRQALGRMQGSLERESTAERQQCVPAGAGRETNRMQVEAEKHASRRIVEAIQIAGAMKPLVVPDAGIGVNDRIERLVSQVRKLNRARIPAQLHATVDEERPRGNIERRRSGP